MIDRQDTNDTSVRNHSKWKKLKFWSKRANTTVLAPSKVTTTTNLEPKSVDTPTKISLGDQHLTMTRTALETHPHQPNHPLNDSHSWKSTAGSGSASRSVASLTKYPEATLSTREKILQLESRAKLKLLAEQMKTESTDSALKTIENTSVLYAPQRDSSTGSSSAETTSKKKLPTSWKMFFDDNSLLADSIVDRDDGESMSIPHERLDLQYRPSPQTESKYIDQNSSVGIQSGEDEENIVLHGENMLMRELEKSSFDQCYCIRPQRTPSLDAKFLSPSFHEAPTDLMSNEPLSTVSTQRLHNIRTMSPSVGSDPNNVVPKEKATCIGPLAQFQQWSKIFTCDVEGSLGSNEEQEELHSENASYIYDKDGFTKQDSFTVDSYTESLDDWTEYDGGRMTRKNWMTIAELEIQKRMISRDESKATFQTREYESSETESSTSFDDKTNYPDDDYQLNHLDSHVKHPMDRVSSSNRKLFNLVNQIQSPRPPSLSARSYKADAIARSSRDGTTGRSYSSRTNSNLPVRRSDISHQEQTVDALSNRQPNRESEPPTVSITSNPSTDTASAWLEHVVEINKSMKRGITVAEHRQKAINKYAV
jgi:hypothetical protein